MAHRINAYTPDGRLATVSNDAFRVEYLYTPDRLDAGYVVTTAGGVEIARHVSRDLWRRHLVTVVSNSVSSIFHSPFSILHSYSYDALGRPVSRGGDDFGYNARSEVAWTTIGDIDAEYSYDPAGNFTTSVWDGAASAYSANTLNQYTAISSGGTAKAPLYAACGSLTNAAPLSFRYGFSGNLLVGIYSNKVHSSDWALYDYDGEGRRAYRSNHIGNQAWGSVTYYYSGWSLVSEDVGRTARRNYVWGRDLSGTLDGAGGVGGLLATEVGGVWYFPLYDNNGNITDYVSETGEVVASYAYDAFGRTIAQSGTMADVFPFRFSTKYYDAEAGLYYYGYRYYSPELGRWMTRDPIEENGGDNLYAFVHNNPLIHYDILGREENQTKKDYTKLVKWSAQVQYVTKAFGPLNIVVPIPISVPIYAALPQEISGKAPAMRKRRSNRDCPYFVARKLTIYATPTHGFDAIGANSVYDANKNLKFEPFIAIVPSGTSAEGHWESTWSDVRVMWRYDAPYNDPPFVKKHVDYFFNGQKSGKWDIHRAIVEKEGDRNVTELEVKSFILENTLGEAPGSFK